MPFPDLPDLPAATTPTDNDTAGRVTGERWYTCPITGLTFPESEGVYRKGRRLHPSAVDAPGRKERFPSSTPAGSQSTRTVRPPTAIGEF